jgi:hypothetical protein
MSLLMKIQISLVNCSIPTYLADEALIPSMNFLVFLYLIELLEALTANFTTKWPFFSVTSKVTHQSLSRLVVLPTSVTLIILVNRMVFHVQFQRCLAWKTTVTNTANVSPSTNMQQTQLRIMNRVSTNWF